MNSSFLLWGQLLWSMVTLAFTVLTVWRFGFPRDTVRVLGVMLLLALAVMFGGEGLGAFGVFPIFAYPPLYNVCLGVMAFALPAFVFLGFLDHPTQLQRKVLWRLPLLGALIGHVLADARPLWVAGLAITAIMLFAGRRRDPWSWRLFLRMGVPGVLYLLVWAGAPWWLGWIAVGLWLPGLHRLVEGLLVKNLVRGRLPPQGAPA